MDSIILSYNGQGVNFFTYPSSAGEAMSYTIKTSKNFFEIEFLDYIYKNHREQKNIIDIGANIGNHSVFFTAYLSYDKIYCFEAHPDNANVLQANMKNKNSEVFCVALSNQEGEAILYNSQPNNGGGYSLVCHPNVSFKVMDSVPTRTLDSYNLQDISMIKIDVEAHELQVLEGARQTIMDSHPIMFVEDLHHGYPHMFETHRFDAFFKSMNYILRKPNIGGSYLDLWEYSLSE